LSSVVAEELQLPVFTAIQEGVAAGDGVAVGVGDGVAVGVGVGTGVSTTTVADGTGEVGFGVPDEVGEALCVGVPDGVGVGVNVVSTVVVGVYVTLYPVDPVVFSSFAVMVYVVHTAAPLHVPPDGV
jgi:hypothetical protein